MTYAEFVTVFEPVYLLGNMDEIREFETAHPQHYAQYFEAANNFNMNYFFDEESA